MNRWFETIRQYPYLLLVLANLFWGSNFVFGRLIVATVPPFHVSLLRWIIGFLFFLPFAWHEWKQYREIMIKNWKKLLVLAVTGVAGFNTLLYIGVQYTTSINASLVNSTAPLLIVILSVIFLKERIIGFQYVGIILSFIGVLYVFTSGEMERLITLSFNQGDLFVISAVISWSVYSVLMKRWGSNLPKKATFLSTIILGIAIIAPFTIWESWNTDFTYLNMDWNIWLGIVYLGIFPSIISFVCWNEGVIQVGPSKSSNFLHLIVLFTGIIALIVGETYSLVQFIGGVMILSGVILTSNPSYINK